MGAMRLGKFAKYLLAEGHDLLVLTPKGNPLPQTLPLETPPERIRTTGWLDVNAPPASLAKLRNRWTARGTGSARGHAEAATGADSTGAESTGAESTGAESTGGRSGGLLARLAELYMDLFNFPDSRIGWLPFALFGARRILRRWTPDLIFASGPPFTTLIAGHLLHRFTRVPWVAELRDRWTDDPYFPPPDWRLGVEAKLERRILSTARALITVSQPWAEFYAEKYGKPALAVYNGFDPDDYGQDRPAEPPRDDILRIVYTGRIYPGRRDPSALFAALALLAGRISARVEFYGCPDAAVRPLARRHAVDDLVFTQAHIPYAEAVAVQQAADVLLLLQWNDPKEQGNVPGKLFEYLGARRPILGLGLESGVPATIIRERSAGLYSNDPAAIARQLELWARAKREAGAVPALPEAACAGFSRDQQFRELDAFLRRLLGQAPADGQRSVSGS